MNRAVRIIDSGQNVCIQVVDGAIPIGTADANIYCAEPGWWWLARVKVEERYQCAGIGALLIYNLLEVLKKKDLLGLVVAPGGYGSDIRRLEKFYKANGFRKTKGKEVLRWRKNVSTSGNSSPVRTKVELQTSGSGVGPVDA